MKLNKTISKAIELYLKENNITALELAQKLDTTEVTINRWRKLSVNAIREKNWIDLLSLIAPYLPKGTVTGNKEAGFEYNPKGHFKYDDYAEDQINAHYTNLEYGANVAPLVKEKEYYEELLLNKPASGHEKQYHDWIKEYIPKLDKQINNIQLGLPVDHKSSEYIIIDKAVYKALEKLVDKYKIIPLSQLILISFHIVNSWLNKTENKIDNIVWNRLLPYIYDFLPKAELIEFYTHPKIRDLFGSMDKWLEVAQTAYYSFPLTDSDFFIAEEEKLQEKIKKINTPVNNTKEPHPFQNQEQTESNAKPIPSSQIRMIPVISMASAASYEPAYDPFNDFIENNKLKETIYVGDLAEGVAAIEIEGDSMAPKFPNGTIILFSIKEYPQRGDYVVARMADNGIVFKEYFRKDNVIELRSINPEGKNFKWHIKEDPGYCFFMWPVLEAKINLRHQRWEEKKV